MWHANYDYRNMMSTRVMCGKHTTLKTGAMNYLIPGWNWSKKFNGSSNDNEAGIRSFHTEMSTIQ